jgi:hypothetical protein
MIINDQCDAFVNEKVDYLVKDLQENSTLSQIVSKSSMNHRIKCFHHIHVQKRDYFVVTLILDDVYLLRKMF